MNCFVISFVALRTWGGKFQEKLDLFVCKIRAGHPLPNPHGNEATRELAPDEKANDEADSVLHFQADTESNARGKLLVYLLKNGMLRKNDVETVKPVPDNDIATQPCKTVHKDDTALQRQ